MKQEELFSSFVLHTNKDRNRVKGITDDTFTRFLELCERLHISPMAIEELGLMLYEVYYEGYDRAINDERTKRDLKKGIEEWKHSLNK